MSPTLFHVEAAELLAELRGLTDRGAVLAATRPYTLTTVRTVTRLLTKRTAPASASRADLAYAIAVALRRGTTRSSRARRRDTSPTACTAARTCPLAFDPLAFDPLAFDPLAFDPLAF